MIKAGNFIEKYLGTLSPSVKTQVAVTNLIWFLSLFKQTFFFFNLFLAFWVLLRVDRKVEDIVFINDINALS
jgi:hypothetical protein